ncbi:Glyoxalase/Bleomycin resistance protein/Dihydroxybiphenyl dioxygenase [Xylariaceae sp. AK1471]|nr:Glyoxalase/Bleomycin resistance protein/Dihydroxybiphenyl dioxygenase [Xylariaceae sp. AK1471]
MSMPPTKLTHVLETCLYVRSKSESESFYQDILGLVPSIQSQRISVYPLDNTTLILFQLGLTLDDIHPEDHPEFTVPAHGPTQLIIDSIQSGSEQNGGQQRLQQHFCLAVPSRQDAERWEEYLNAKDVKILGLIDWERGGRSVYFADPDGHIGEIGSRGIWTHY